MDGRDMEVTDLAMPILQADDNHHHRVKQPTEYHLYLYDYWEDVYQKLLLLDKDIKKK